MNFDDLWFYILLAILLNDENFVTSEEINKILKNSNTAPEQIRNECQRRALNEGCYGCVFLKKSTNNKICSLSKGFFILPKDWKSLEEASSCVLSQKESFLFDQNKVYEISEILKDNNNESFKKV